MKRRITHLAIFLLLGTVINTTIAWGLALWPRRATMLYGNEPKILLTKDVQWWNANVKPQFGCDVGYGYLTHDFGIQGAMLFDSEATLFVTAIRLSSGWPFRSFTGDGWTKIPPREPFPNWQTDDAMVFQQLGGFMIPLRPMWTGFAINTFFYAVFAWGIYIVISSIRKKLRRVPGLCTICNYDLTHADHKVCPECGTPNH